MSDDPLCRNGMRRLRDLRDTRSIADRLAQVTVRTAFTDEDRAFTESHAMFFVTTADEQFEQVGT